MTLRSALLVALALFTVTGCSSESGSAESAGAIPSTFDAYCKGTLKVARDYMTPAGPSAWSGFHQTLPAGTTVLVSSSFDTWSAYAFLHDGTPAKIEGDFTKGLVPGVDFDAPCIDKGKDRANQRTVLLARSTFHADASLGGTACALEAGQVLTGYSFSSSGSAAQISSPEIKSTCGYDKAYTNDVTYATLVLP